MATAGECPPDLVSIAGGKEFPVRGDLLWTQHSAKPSKLLVENTIADLTVASPGSDMDDSTSDITSGSSSSAEESDAEGSQFSGFSSDEERAYPPSPPIKTVTLPITVPGLDSPLSSSSSSDEDYFSIRSSGKTFLDDVFPRSKIVSKAVTVPSGSKSWDLALLEENSATVLYCKGSAFEALNLRENLVGLLDRADEEYEADQVVVVLDKRDPNLATILHSLMYVGGVVIPRLSTSIHRKHSSQCVLVGIEI